VLSGKEVLRSFSDRREEQQVVRHAPRKESIDIVDGYGKMIRRAREVLGLSTKVLAEKINEKESAIIRVEEEKGLPDDKLAKKLEHQLGIRLLVAQQDDNRSYSNAKQNEITIGDSLIIKDKRKGS